MPTLGELAALLGGAVEGNADLEVEGVAAIDAAGPAQITFLTDEKYLPALGNSAAAAVLIAPGVDSRGKPALRVANPMAALPALLAKFAPAVPEDGGEAVHPTAVIHPTARLGAGARVEPYAVIEAGAVIGERARIGALSVVGAGSRIGRETRLMPFVAVGERTSIGERVLIHSGTVLGADGFGFLPGPSGPVKIPQIGRVVIEDDVEIGANCTIDRAMVGDTLIKRTAKIDDQVHVAHNCVIAEGCVVAGQTGMGGTAKLGRGCRIGAQAGIADHVTLGDGVEVGGKSGIHKDVPPGDKVFGYPARSAREAFRINAAVSRLPGLLERMRELEKRLAELEGGAKSGAGEE